MNHAESEPLTLRPPGRTNRDPLVLGTVCGLTAAVGYTLANICLRAVSGADPVWVSAVKSFPTVAIFGPWLFVLALRRIKILPALRTLGALVVAALIGQLLGNVLFQWSLGVIGIALTVPVTLGTMIAGGAFLGRVLLGETITLRMVLAMLTLITAIFVLSLGAGEAHRSVTGLHVASDDAHVFLELLAGVAAAATAGLAYAFLGVVIRAGVAGQTPLATTLVTVGLVGAVTLVGATYWRIGFGGMLATPPTNLAVMFLAGICNAAAFLALTKALQLTGVVYVNALNASQAAMAAAAGVLIFHEAISLPMLAGVLLTALGLLLMRRPRPRRPTDARSAVNEPARSTHDSHIATEPAAPATFT